MSLSDIMGQLDLSVYPQIGLVIFLAVFALVVARLLARGSRAASRRHAMIPLTEASVSLESTPLNIVSQEQNP